MFSKFFGLGGKVRRPQHRSSPARKAVVPNRERPQVEELESRLAPACTTTIVGGVLTVNCTGPSNTVTVDHDSGFCFPFIGRAIINGSAYCDLTYNSIRINGGTSGQTTNIRANVKPLSLFGAGSTDVVNVGDQNDGNIGVKGIQATLTLRNPPQFNTINIGFAFYTENRTVTFSNGSVTGLAPAAINFDCADTRAVNVSTRGPLTFNVLSTCPLAFNGTLRINHRGPDSTAVNISSAAHNLNTISGNVEFNKPDGAFGTKNIFDQNGPTGALNYILDGGSVIRTGSARITFVQVINVQFNSLVINGANGPNTYQVNGTSASVTTLNTGTGSDTVNVQATSGPLTIQEQGIGYDTVNIAPAGRNLNTIRGRVEVDGNGHGELNVFDQNGPTGAETYLVYNELVGRADSAAITYSGIPYVGINGANGPNTYVVNYNNSPGRTLNTGAGSDTMHVQATMGPLLIQEQGSGNDTVNIAPADRNLNAIQGRVTVNGNSGFDTLNIFDQNGPTGALTYVLNSSVFNPHGSVVRTGSATVAYNFIKSVVINGANGPNTYDVNGTSIDTSFGTTLNTGTGHDTVNVRATSGPLTIQEQGSGSDTVNLTNGGNTVDGIANVTVDDPTGTSTVVVDDSGFLGDETYSITNAAVNVGRLPGALLSYSGIGNLVVNGGTSTAVQDTFDIDSTSAGTTVNASPGVLNCFHVSPTAQWLGANVLGPLTINGSGSGADVLDFFDTNDPNPETFTFDAVPSTLTLGTTPGFLCNFSGFATGSVYVLTNGFSTPNDASGTVIFDPAGGPPCAPVGPGQQGGPTPVAYDVLAQAVADVMRSESSAVRAAVIPDAMLAELMHHRARKSVDGLTVLALAALAG
jgi:hypothetical protein